MSTIKANTYLDASGGNTATINGAVPPTAASPALTGQVSFDDGTAALPSITNAGDTNTGVFFPAADTVAVATAGTERVRVTSAGDVGVGTASPAEKLSVAGAIRTHTASSAGFTLDAKGGLFDFVPGSVNVRLGYVPGTSGDNSGVLTFVTGAGSEAARIDASGRLLLNGSTSYYSSGTLQVLGGKTIIRSDDTNFCQLQIGAPTNAEASIAFIPKVTSFGTSPTSTDGDNSCWAMGPGVYGVPTTEFSFGNKGRANYVAKVAYNGTSWTFSSDERLKNLDGEIENAVEKVSSLRAVYYRWKDDESNKRKVGLIAQDVLAVLPEAVDVPEADVDDKGNPKYLGLGMTDVVPLLVAAIKELKAEVDSLRAQLNP